MKWLVRKKGELNRPLIIEFKVSNDSLGNIDWFVTKYPDGFGEIRGYPEHAVATWLYRNGYEYQEV